MQTSSLKNDLLLEVEKLTPIEKKELQQLLESIQIIQYERIPKRKKIIKLINESKKTSFENIWWVIMKLLKHFWKTSPWSVRLLILGVPASAIVFKNKRIGLATSGFAIGVPIFLLSSAGITFIGTLLDALKNGADSYKNTTTENNGNNNFQTTEPFNTYSDN
jgi:hypothetical protein